MNIERTYIYVYPPSVWRANGQPLVQHNGSYATTKRFYLSDRLGSVRESFVNTGSVNGYSTYSPFDETLESNVAIGMVASFRFAGQYYDTEIGQYYLRARQYDPGLGRFTSRGPLFGKFEEPMTLHKYLYCINNPINRIDPTGLWGPNIHNQIIDEAFPGISDELHRQMYKGSAWVDKLPRQTAQCAFMHAMTAPGQSVEDAKKQMWDFVCGNYLLYQTYKNLGKEDLAYNYLGRAMHPIMDETCPTHDWQQWNPGVFGPIGVEGGVHWVVEPKTIKSTELRETLSKMQNVMKELDACYEVSQILMLIH